MSNDNTRRSQRSQTTGDYRRQEARRVPRTGTATDQERMQARLQEQMRRQMQARMRGTGTTGRGGPATSPDGRVVPAEAPSSQSVPTGAPTDMGAVKPTMPAMPMAEPTGPATGAVPDVAAPPRPDGTDGDMPGPGDATTEARRPKARPSRQSMDAAMRRQMMSMMRGGMGRGQGAPKGGQPQGQPIRPTSATDRLPETDMDDFFDDGGAPGNGEAVARPRPEPQPRHRGQPSRQSTQPRQAPADAYARPVDTRIRPAQGGRYGTGAPVMAGGGYGSQGPQPSPQPQAWAQPAQVPGRPQAPSEATGTPGGEAQQESLASRILGNTLTFSMTLSMVLTPFAFLYVLQPDLMNRILELPFPIIAPIALVYILAMLFLGMRLAAIFGCGPWYRVMTRSSEDG